MPAPTTPIGRLCQLHELAGGSRDTIKNRAVRVRFNNGAGMAAGFYLWTRRGTDA